jgi:hypothetical protein
MLRALVWKEWREQRPVALTGTILAALLALSLGAGLPLVGSRLPVAFAAFVWPILAAAAGASTISAEAAGRTLGFVLSRPVSRSRLWLIKVSVAMLSVMAVAALSLLLVRICNGWFLPGQTGQTYVSFGTVLRRTALGPFDFLALASLSFLLFACATLFSTVISRPLPAAGAGAALALMLLSGILLLWAAFSLSPHLESQWLASELALVSLIVLFISYAVFSRAELFLGRSARRWVVVAVALAVSLAGLVMIPAAAAAGRLRPGEVVISGDGIAVSPAGVVITATASGGREGEIWLVRADGSGTLPLTGSHASSPMLGQWDRYAYYFSRRGTAGGTLGGYDLRAARLDGSYDRLIAAGLPGTGARRLIPYGGRALLTAGDTLYLIELDGSEVTTFDIGARELSGAALAGWIDSLADEVLFVRREATGETGIEDLTLLAFGLTDGHIRTAFKGRIAADGYRQPHPPRSGWRFFPVPVSTGAAAEEPMRIDLVDLNGAGATTLGEGSCFSGRFDRSGRLIYVLCSEADGRSFATVAATGIDRGEARLIAEIDLSGGSVTLVDAWVGDWDPFRAWVVLRQELPSSGAAGGETVAVVLGPEGHRIGMTPGWIPIGLSGSSRLLLVDNLEQIRTIASGDLQTGMLQVIFP